MIWEELERTNKTINDNVMDKLFRCYGNNLDIESIQAWKIKQTNQARRMKKQIKDLQEKDGMDVDNTDDKSVIDSIMREESKKQQERLLPDNHNPGYQTPNDRIKVFDGMEEALDDVIDPPMHLNS